MTEDNQLDLFIKSDIKCKCKNKHALTAHEFEFNLNQAERIKTLILAHGWDLAHNYFWHMDKVDRVCNAWEVDNAPYLTLRADYQERNKEVSIPIQRRR